MSRAGEVGHGEGVPTGQREEVTEEKGAGGGVVERVVRGAAGDERVERGPKPERGDEPLQRVAGQGGVGLAGEAERVDPEGIARQGREAGEDGTLGGDVVRHGDGRGKERVEARPHVEGRRRGGDGVAVGTVLAGRVAGEGVVFGDAEVGVQRRLDATALERDGAELPGQGLKALHHPGRLEVQGGEGHVPRGGVRGDHWISPRGMRWK